MSQRKSKILLDCVIQFNNKYRSRAVYAENNSISINSLKVVIADRVIR